MTVESDVKIINSLAAAYCNEKSEKPEIELKKLKSNLWIKLFGSKSVMKIVVNAIKKNSKLSNETLNNLYISDGTNEAINKNIWDDAIFMFNKCIDDYDVEKNDNFTAYLATCTMYEIRNKVKKISTKKTIKDEYNKEIKITVTRKEYSTDEELKASEITHGDLIEDKSLNPEEKYLAEDWEKRLRRHYLNVYLGFYDYKKGRSANDSKRLFYRIFINEIIMHDIKRESDNSVSAYVEYRKETMETLDKSYVEFVAFGDFKELEDIEKMNVKHYSDIFEDGSDDELKLKHEPKVIIEYRYKSGIDKKRISDAAVSQHFKSFESDFKGIIKDH